jgi:hypothetical protein
MSTPESPVKLGSSIGIGREIDGIVRRRSANSFRRDGDREPSPRESRGRNFDNLLLAEGFDPEGIHRSDMRANC